MKSIDPTPDELRNLLQRVARRDAAAFESIVKRYNGRLTRYASFKLNDPHEINDVINDTLLAVWDNPTAYQSQSGFFTYLISIMNRKVVDKYRQKGRQIETWVDESGEWMDDTPSGDAETGHGDPAFWLHQSQAIQRFADCKDKLSLEQQAVLFWLFEMEATETEAAAHCQCPVGTVKSRYAAARNAIKRCLMGWHRQTTSHG
ncbi:MAG: RNA polymerase sigma factor [Hydrogenophaga sp.]|nr:RNA polymerase sigma factor [Hydrogenophaga sp.]